MLPDAADYNSIEFPQTSFFYPNILMSDIFCMFYLGIEIHVALEVRPEVLNAQILLDDSVQGKSMSVKTRLQRGEINRLLIIEKHIHILINVLNYVIKLDNILDQL